jgi:hypothetical protein
MLLPVSRPFAPLAVLLTICATPALAGEAACWFENGVVVVSAEVMGVPGDYILDTATPHTQLADSQAQTAGFAETALVGEVRLAGVVARGRPVAVEVLDLRTGALPTPIAGVIGADVLKDYVVDVTFAPCRVSLRRAGRAPRFPAATSLAMRWVADTGVRLSDALAKVAGAAKPKELYPYGVYRPRLRAFSFAGVLSENLPAGLVKAEDPALAGQIGAPILSHWRLRFDFPAGRLLLAPAG